MCSIACVSVHIRKQHALNKMGQCQCINPLPAGKTLRLLPWKAGSRHPRVQTSPNRKARKKIARLAQLTSPLLRRKEGAIFSISSALDAPDPECHEKVHLDVSSWLAGLFYPHYHMHPGDDQKQQTAFYHSQFQPSVKTMGEMHGKKSSAVSERQCAIQKLQS